MVYEFSRLWLCSAITVLSQTDLVNRGAFDMTSKCVEKKALKEVKEESNLSVNTTKVHLFFCESGSFFILLSCSVISTPFPRAIPGAGCLLSRDDNYF